MLLYEPTENEIVTTLGHAAARAPSLRSRLERAGDLLRTGALFWDGNGWRCRSERETGLVYTLDFHACDCPDHQSGRAAVHEMVYCKHTLALLAYREICIAHLRERKIGDLHDHLAAQAARRAANAALLSNCTGDGRSTALFAWRDARRLRPECICAAVATVRGLAPQDEGHLAAFAAWLGQAAPLPPDLEAEQLYRRMVSLGFSEEDAAGVADSALAPEPERVLA